MAFEKRLLLMIVCVFLFFAVEIIVGHYSKSNALIADAFHMLSDVVALIIAYLASYTSSKPWKRNTYGFARTEVLGALTNAVILMAICFTIFSSSIQVCG